MDSCTFENKVWLQFIRNEQTKTIIHLHDLFFQLSPSRTVWGIHLIQHTLPSLPPPGKQKIAGRSYNILEKRPGASKLLLFHPLIARIIMKQFMKSNNSHQSRHQNGEHHKNLYSLSGTAWEHHKLSFLFQIQWHHRFRMWCISTWQATGAKLW